VNLLKTMVDNGLSSPDLGVRENRGGRGVGWGPMSGSRFLQAFVGKTDIFKRPLLGRLC
jgi:hypothetical protein